MGYGMSDILPCRAKEEYEEMLRVIDKIKQNKKMTVKDFKAVKGMESIFKDVLEMWDRDY